MIEIKNLTKRYGDKVAVDNVSFTVNDGEILGFLGPNGAGKSTTMNILTGYLSATEGQAIIDGYDILEEPMEAKKRIGYLPELPPLYMDMTVDEYLDFMYDLKKVRVGASKKDHITAICNLVKIADVRKRMIRNLSKGYKQRVGIAQALLGNPEVLILDEPTVGLDPKQIIEIRSLIKNLSQSHTVILSSHILSEIQAVCDRVIVINRGKLVADDTETNLSNKMSGDLRYTVRIEGPQQEVLSVLESIPAMESVQALGEKETGVWEYIIEAKEGEDIRREVFKRMASRGWPIMGLKSSELTLEDIFLQLTQDSTYGGEE
ncbi:MAG: ABC transporter ATP-binding protein [Massiliimalia sp.]